MGARLVAIWLQRGTWLQRGIMFEYLLWLVPLVWFDIQVFPLWPQPLCRDILIMKYWDTKCSIPNQFLANLYMNLHSMHYIVLRTVIFDLWPTLTEANIVHIELWLRYIHCICLQSSNFRWHLIDISFWTPTQNGRMWSLVLVSQVSFANRYFILCNLLIYTDYYDILTIKYAFVFINYNPSYIVKWK